jgi:hypothetical protein
MAGFGILGTMKAAPLLILAALTALPTFAQYSARTLTRRIVPQPQPQQPARPAPAPQPAYRPAVVPQTAAPRPAAPADPVKAAAEKAKNESKKLEFYRRRAEEGSDHAQYELGMRYLTGKGTEPNEKLAREWLTKSARQGYPQAKKKLEELGPAPASDEKTPAATASASATPPTKSAQK